MTALKTLNKFGYFERRSQFLSDITCKSFVRIPWLCTLYCVTRGALSSPKYIRMEYIRLTFLWKLFVVPSYNVFWLEHNVANHTTGLFRTVPESLDALLRLHLMPIRNFFFNLYWNITNTTFPLSMPRITALDEWDNFSKPVKTSQILLFWTPRLSSSYDVWGGTLATNPLKIKRIYVTFTSYLTEMRDTTCFALQVKIPSSLPAVRNETDIVK